MVKEKRDATGVEDEQCRGRYAVLGWYRIRDAWEELEAGGMPPDGDPHLDDRFNDQVPLFVRFKFAFEWVEAQGTPWWIEDAERAYTGWLSSRSEPSERAPSPGFSATIPSARTVTPCINLWKQDHVSDPPGLYPDPQLSSPLSHKCANCLETSPLIYHEGWFCTNAQCSQMGLVRLSVIPDFSLNTEQLSDGRFSPEVTLSYSQDFIDRLPLSEPALIGLDGNDISPFIFPSREGSRWSVIPRYREDRATYEREHWNGRCCLRCGRLNLK